MDRRLPGNTRLKIPTKSIAASFDKFKKISTAPTTSSTYPSYPMRKWKYIMIFRTEIAQDWNHSKQSDETAVDP